VRRSLERIDGIVFYASLVLGVIAAGADAQGVLGLGRWQGLSQEAMSMAAGSIISVSSQSRWQTGRLGFVSAKS